MFCQKFCERRRNPGLIVRRLLVQTKTVDVYEKARFARAPIGHFQTIRHADIHVLIRLPQSSHGDSQEFVVEAFLVGNLGIKLSRLAEVFGDNDAQYLSTLRLVLKSMVGMMNGVCAQTSKILKSTLAALKKKKRKNPLGILATPLGKR